VSEQTTSTRTFHYVPHFEALDWLAMGWVVVRPNVRVPSFDQYVSTMEWLCNCPMARPARLHSAPDAKEAAK
jgi:hypothetical protein